MTNQIITATEHKVIVKAERAALHAYSVSCPCGYSKFVQGRKARESAREYARQHRQQVNA
jgi:hypothetical protein